MSPRYPTPIRFGAALRLLTFAAAATTTLAADRPVRTVTSTAAPPRDHHLFVGVTPFLLQDRDLLEVRRFEGKAAVVVTPTGEPLQVPRDHGFQFKMKPKISPILVELDQVRGEETFSPWTDPQGQWMSRQMALSGHYDDQSTNAVRELSSGMKEAHMIARVEESNGGPAPGTSVTAESTMNAAISEYQNTQAGLQSYNDSASITAHFNPIEEPDEAAPFDAINLRFRIASPDPIADAHALARVRIRTPDEGYQDISFQRDIGALDRSRRSVLMTLDGLPPGFEFIQADIHIFHQGEELATNRSERHLALTGAEAREYLLLDHLSQHRGDTVPASPVWSLAPRDLRTAGAGDSLDHPATVEVDPQGRAVNVAAPEGRILPAHARDLLARLTYFPALQDGTPVASTIQVNLADYFR